MVNVKIEDYSINVKNATERAAIRWLEEASVEIESQAKQNSRVKTGQTKGSFEHIVYEAEKKAEIGSPKTNALWEELGTGEHALNGDGRKGGWRYQDLDGKWHYTKGKKGTRALHKAFVTKKPTIKRMAEQIFGGLDG